jgi:peptide/nickel transport system ATP-binding protein
MPAISFDVYASEILGMQGRSGCGKTSTALAILRLLPPDARVSGSGLFQGRDLLQLSDRELRRIRGRHISIMYQEPTLALNPVMRVGDQIAEVARAHGLSDCKIEARAMLERVGLEPTRYYVANPHELSGGERHRVLLAQALICRPQLVIADEPTASLDAALRTQILELIVGLRQQFGTAFLLVSHDRSIISSIADRVIELAPESRSQTIKPVLQALPRAHVRNADHQLPEPLLTIHNLSKRYRTRGLFAFGRTDKQALDAVTLNLHRGTLTGLIGPSGSGKSTLARCLALLEDADGGEILFQGRNLLQLTRDERRRYRPMLQYVAQDPAAALNPRLTAAKAIEEPMLIQGIGEGKERRTAAEELMHRVGLDPAQANRSCHKFSGGQKHRLAIARSLALEPKLLIFDESLSGLDPETQAEILSLLTELRATLGLTQLLISHDLELVSAVADRLMVMGDGKIVPEGALGHAKQRWSDRSLDSAPKRELVLAESE